jgi:hypothetical protein
MSSRIGRVNILGAVTVLALICLSAGNAQTQVCTNTIYQQSSFEFPLWSDATWKQFNAYSSIQMADIDGDGQVELLGKGPAGIEVWHWEPYGQAWLNMNLGTPPFQSTDMLMTADVNGDGQAEIIQITATSGASTVVKVWHYNLITQVWTLLPQLQLTLSPNGSSSAPLAPMIKFADLNHSGRQELVNLSITGTATERLYVPQVYQVKADGSGWATLVSGNPIPESPSAPVGSFQLGDVTGDGLPDIVIQMPNVGFVVYAQQAAGTSVSLSAPDTFSLPNVVPAFALAPMLPSYAGDQIVTIPVGGNLEWYQYQSGGRSHQIASDTLPATTASSDASQYSTLQAAFTGLDSSNPAGATLLMLGTDGLDEFGVGSGLTWAKISNTPFISKARFGDDPSHYLTIQTGKVFAFTPAGAQYTETILVGRDANGIHTLSSATCGSASPIPAFTLAATPYYFPAFTTSGTAQAYEYLSNQIIQDVGKITTNTSSVRLNYTNIYADANTYHSDALAAVYPGPGYFFSLADFTTVKNQLVAELHALNNVVTYMNTSATNLAYINTGESSGLTNALTALNLPPDSSTNVAGQELAANAPLQAVESILGFIGNTGIPIVSQLAEAFSVIGDIVSDVQSYETQPLLGGNLADLGLALQTQLSNTYNDQVVGNGLTETRLSQNWDLMSQLSSDIDNRLISANSADLNSASDAAITTFAITSWQELVPSVWEIIGVNCRTGEDGSLPGGYQGYFVDGQSLNINDESNVCYSAPATYVVYAKLQSTPDAMKNEVFPPAPVPLNQIQPLIDLGVNWYDVLGQRNGWQQIPADPQWHFAALWTIPSTNPYFNPPAPPTAPLPSVGLPASLLVSGGTDSGKTNPSCGLNTLTVIFEQSTPINSVFQSPIGIAVLDKTATGVPNATVQITGIGLSPNINTVVTDANGNASVSLLANGVIQGPYTASFTVLSPHEDPSQPSCSVTQPYQLQNTPSMAGSVPTNPDLQAVVSVQSKGAVFATDRLWNLSITDPTGTATSGTFSGQLTHTRGPSTCNPVNVVTDTLHTTSAPGQFTSQLGWDFTSCTGLNLFTLTVNGTFTIPLSDGTTYNATYSASTNNQTP